MRALIVLLVSVFCFISSSAFAQEKCPNNSSKCIAASETPVIEGKTFAFEGKCYKVSRLQNGDLLAKATTKPCFDGIQRVTHLGRSQNVTRSDGAIVLGDTQLLVQVASHSYLVRLSQIPIGI